MSTDQHIQQAIAEAKEASPKDLEELESFRLAFLGKKGKIPAFYAQLKQVPKEQKREIGQHINELKEVVNAKLETLKPQLEKEQRKKAAQDQDLTLPPLPFTTGGLHPIDVVRNELVDIFGRIGFDLAKGDQITDEWTNFTALNMPEDHPARDMQDTFFVANKPGYVLRTHTSGVQVNVMQGQKPPIRTISPGMVFRKDNDATHSPFFHQVEGLYVDKNVSFADLKQTLYYLVNTLFGEGTDFRLRPSYFPFTEPSAEMDIAWNKNGEKSWMEILGCGMVDPAVLQNCGIDPDEYTGFAFGIGIERIAMLKYGIQDIRTFYENDLRFLSQFKAV